MPSDFQMILMSIQGDLNAIMLSSIAANQALANMLGVYSDEEYSVDKSKMYTHKWSLALACLADALEAFQRDAGKLEDYINGQR